MPAQPVLWYFADPMCSWCWGFAPVIDAIKAAHGDRLRIALMLGGLRPDATAPTTPERRAEILHHWHEVQRRTGQAFRFDGALPAGFVYDTEPACRAVVAMASLQPAATFAYFKTVQAAFYAEGLDVTRAETLAALAGRHDLDAASFLARFQAEDTKTTTRTHFLETRRSGVRGFPTVVLQAATGTEVLASGYRPFAEIEPRIAAALTE